MQHERGLLRDLCYEAVEVGVGRPFTRQVAAADVEDGLVVNHEGAVRVFEGRVRRQD